MDLKKIIREYYIATYRVDEAYSRYSKTLGLSESELCLIYALYPNYELSQKEICKDWQIPKSTLNTTLKKYEKEGLISMSYLPNNKNEMKVSLTDNCILYAKKFIDEIQVKELEAMKKVMEKYGTSFIDAANLYADILSQGFKIGNK